ncbi:sulfite exporter TauE/SafE family protein [Sulfitobacter sp. KE34]|uniref:Probable membrane transporter protein n=1 Tax=Sulfitobacter faviae TaxID=1775881 RepID=A0AAX3LVA3_9RHOB|nr:MULTISPECIES: sulfite exporter TauE/SafE family protein [Sulfitobacter]MDF3351185.1 sulfite exporter TauE/SafE family protein [Sulfitobacter sp. KE12]MDF3354857.1 sulfite exporter TauE/SafE family protein [Sulfitobacter sp. KE27]MDF3358505.1 sulfite exporter TauE/SafE family protein [Sulfitobacter sp. KE33]MDF3362321.1 sulfite exporter TauE/SafE family protein [Sulfitobacter sp. Ks41]MDF3365929.1 sulfite exporter TauE/SafE family protein [Sulfitobacter sp. Ks34]
MNALDFSQLLPLLAIAVSAGVFGGILAGLLGVGGGIVIVPALYLALSTAGMDPAITMQVAVGTSLATIVFTSLSSGYGHFKRGAIDMDLLKLWAPSLLIGVVIGALLGGYVSGLILVGVFATVAALVALDMIFRKTKDDPTPRGFAKPIWAILGVVTGGLSAMMGIGGGTIGVPLLNFLGYDIRRAVGTSAAIGFIIGLPGAVVYALTGLGAEGLPPFSLGYVNLAAAAIIIPLTSSFAHVGVKLAHSMPRRALRFAFGIFLMVTSLRMFIDLFEAFSNS